MVELDFSQASDAELEQMAGQLREYVSSPDVAGVDKSQGADALTRAGASFKSDPNERLSFVKSRLGAENVATTANGDIVWRKPGDKKWRAFDEEGLSFSDVADFVGDVPEIVGATVGGIGGGVGGAAAGAPAAGVGAVPGAIAGSVKGAAVGSALGNVVKQSISALLPGEESLRPMDRAKDVAISGALGAAGQKIGNAVSAFLSPSIRAARPASQYAQEGENLAKAVGGELTTGQRTGSQAYRVTEDYLRRNPSAAGIMADFEVEKQLKPVKAYLDRTLEKLSSTEVPDEALGTAFRSAYDRAARTLADQVINQGERDFRFLKMAVGDTPIFEPQNFMGELKLLAQRYGDPKMPPDMKPYAKKAVDLVDHYASQTHGGRYSAQDMQDLLKMFGKAGYGRGPLTILEGLERSDQTRIARDLFQALTKDLDLAAQATTTIPVPLGTSTTNVAKLLKQARDNYAYNMKAVDELGLSVIGKKIGKMKGEVEPERIAEWAQTLRPSGLSATMDILETMRPGIRGETARNMVESALTRATQAAHIAGTGPARAPFSPEVFLKSLADQDTFKAILGPNAPSLKEITTAAEYLQRVIERTSGSSSLMGGNLFKAGLSIARHPLNATREVEAILAPRTMAKLLTDAEAVKRLRVLSQAAGRRTARTQEAVAWFAQRGIPAGIIEVGVEIRD